MASPKPAMQQRETINFDDTYLLSQVIPFVERDNEWRGMILLDEKNSTWITLRKADAELISFCTQMPEAFGSIDYSYHATFRPMVKLKKYGMASAAIEGVWHKILARYVRHSEMADAKNAVTTATVAAPTQEQDKFSQIRSMLDKNIERATANRRKALAEGGVTVMPDEATEHALVRMDVIGSADKQQGILGQVQLLAFWDMYKRGSFRKLPKSPGTVLEAAKLQTWQNREYILSLARIVDRVFADVDARASLGKPYTFPNDAKTPITVEYLLSTDGLVKKLLYVSRVWENILPNDFESRQKLMAAVVSKSSAAVEGEIDQVANKTVISAGNGESVAAGVTEESESPSETTTTKPAQEFKLIYEEQEIDDEPDKVRVTMILTRQQKAVFDKTFQAVVGVQW